MNFFYHTKYFTTFLIFLLFNILSTFHFSILSTFTSLTSSTFFFSNFSLYLITQLISTTRWILIKVGSLSLTVLVDTTF